MEGANLLIRGRSRLVRITGPRIAYRTADGSRLAIEAVVALFAARQNATLLLEVGHGDGGQGGGVMVLGGVVVCFADRDNGVDYMGLNGFFNRRSQSDAKREGGGEVVRVVSEDVRLFTTGWIVSCTWW